MSKVIAGAGGLLEGQGSIKASLVGALHTFLSESHNSALFGAVAGQAAQPSGCLLLGLERMA